MMKPVGTTKSNGDDAAVGSSPPRTNPFLIRLSLTTIVLWVLVTSLGSFTLGRLVGKGAATDIMIVESSSTSSSSSPTNLFPFTLGFLSPALPEGKRKPDFVYSGKHFDDTHGGVSSRKIDVRLDDTSTAPQAQARRSLNGSFEILATGDVSKGDNVEDTEDDYGDHEDEEVHQPRGQQLLVDVKNVDASFLNSEEQLAQAMLSLTTQSELTLLSYHCHALQPVGVSCVGVLLESHISFHTWPAQGVITLDLFTCGSKSIMPLIPVIEKLFAVPQKSSSSNSDDTTTTLNDNSSSTTTSIHKAPPPPRAMWAHKKRGFDLSEEPGDYADYENFYLGWMEYDVKKQVAYVETPFQEFEVYDISRMDNYERSLLSSSNDDDDDDVSYESQNPKLFQPDRLLFLSEVLQSTLRGLEAYHEALVHPAMMAHADPKRVAIIGGGEGKVALQCN
jgi:S-adenosylmethionine decarboxylase proenzyme